MEDASQFTPRTDLTRFASAVEKVKAQIGKLIVGQQEMIELMLAAVLADGHILIEGVPGVAKTLTAKLLASSLDCVFSRIQFTPDLMPADVIGTSVFNASTANFDFRAGPIFAQIVLIDEINRAPAKTQAALFEAMEERQVTVDGKTHRLEPPFMVVATQNPIEQEGTYRLPEAQLDRFLFKITVSYPTAEEELLMLKGFQSRNGVNDLSELKPVLAGQEIRTLQSTVRQLHISPELMQYIVQIVGATRNSRDLYLGASPRASINLMTASKALAAIRGRDFVVPEDVKFLAGPVLRHRIILTPEREMEGQTPDQVIARQLEQIEVPR